jgi:mannosylglycerate hydrolase
MNTIHVISHTHWDREWYRTFQQFRLKLVYLVDGMLEILERDKEYKHFMLDGQTIILDDYLQLRPEKKEILCKYIQNGRILIGPWHILPDMFLVGPEAHIRNLLQGARTARRFGPTMAVGYIPDPFGHPGQIPQILRGFGIDTACVWRGVGLTNAEFWWQSPDGSRVLMVNLRDGYGNGASLPADNLELFASQLAESADSLVRDSATTDLLIMFGTDHMEPPSNTSEAIAYADEMLRDSHVVHSTLPQYVLALKQVLDQKKVTLPVVEGELRACRRMHLLPGVLSARMWIKQRNRACEILLEKWVEPFVTFQEQAAHQTTHSFILNPKDGIVRHAWRLLMENHPHDSICGCSIDQVHEEMKVRFDQVDQIGEELTRQSLEAIAGCIQTDQGLRIGDSTTPPPVHEPSSALVIFNPIAGLRTDVITVRLEAPPSITEFDLVDENGALVPYQEQGLGTHEIINMTMDSKALISAFSNVKDGRVVGMAFQDIRIRRDGVGVFIDATLTKDGEPNLPVFNAERKRMDEYIADPSITTYHVRALSMSTLLTIVVPAVPGHGYRTLWIRPRTVEGKPPVRLNPLFRAILPLGRLPFVHRLLTRKRYSKPPYIIENGLFSVEAQSDGTLTLQDKRDGKVYTGLNRFQDGGDCGDEYNYSPPETDLVTAPTLKNVSITRGPVQQTLELEMELVTPLALDPSRKSRSTKKVAIPIKTAVTLSNDVPRIDIHTWVDNLARDHRLRVHFLAPFAAATGQHDGHFEVVERPVGVPVYDNTWVEQPRPESPQRAFTSITDGQARLTIANRGLPEVEVMKNALGNAEIALTLLRCVGWLSRDDFSTRKGNAGPPFTETPGAQVPGLWEFDYSIIPGKSDLSSYREAYSFETPMQVVSTGLHSGTLPVCESFVDVEPATFLVSAVKQAEDGNGWLVRGYNITEEVIQVTLKPWKPFKKVEKVNLGEEKIAELQADNRGRVTLPVRGYEIVSVLFQE